MASNGILPVGTMVMINLDPSTISKERIDELSAKTGVAFVYPVFGTIIKCNHPIYNVEWTIRDSSKTIKMDMNRSELKERFPKFFNSHEAHGNLGRVYTNNLTPDEIRAAAQAVKPGPEQGGGKKARKSRKVRKSRKSHKKSRKSRKAHKKSRKSRRRVRR